MEKKCLYIIVWTVYDTPSRGGTKRYLDGYTYVSHEHLIRTAILENEYKNTPAYVRKGSYEGVFFASDELFDNVKMSGGILDSAVPLHTNIIS